MKNVIVCFCLLLISQFMFAQSVEVQGQLKVTTVNQNNVSTDVLVRNTDGSVGKRDAGTIGGVPSTGIVLSETEVNPNLTSSGFTKIGNILMDMTTNMTTSWMGMPATTLAPRSSNIAIFTGTEIIIWGGANFSTSTYYGDGAKFNPSTGNWSAISAVGAPTARAGATAVLDAPNSRIIVWGGYSSSSTALNSGSIYNYNSNTWTAISSGLPNMPSQRWAHSAIWTGTEMIIWGGYDFSIPLADGSAYNPVSNTWTTLPSTGLAARFNHTAEWTGSEMVIWGGENGNLLDDGARYNPSGGGVWTGLPVSGLSPRKWHRSVDTGTEMIIWGGNGANPGHKDGAKYNYATNTWTLLSAPPATFIGRWYHNQVYTGIGSNKMIIYGGYDGSTSLADGAIYDIGTDTWTTMNPVNAPVKREYGLNTRCIWANDKFYVWGGGSRPPLAALNDGAQCGLLTITTPMFLFRKN